MKLLRLTLQGFKSFADKTTIDFSDGMTVIVGPNGCGKSNISDAVRWVLGEQNVRNLRGQKTEDIIFSGSETRNPKNGAEVALVLDNSAHELPLDTAEVSISRRVLRNGDSDFQLNKRSCRLKDIQELLASTGLGKGSLAIIGQNRVDQVLTARPEERRLIFEDVAGISLYRMRKNEGLRKLERTAENMDRVKDMTALLDEQLVPLKEGAEKAKAYKKLLVEKRAIEASMSLLKLTSVRRMMARYENEYIALKDQDVKCQARLAQCSLAKETLEKARLSHQEEMRVSGETLSKAQQKMESLRGDFRVKEEALHHAQEKWGELTVVEEDQTEAEKELAEEIESAKEEWQQAKTEWAHWTEKKDSAEKEKAQLETALQTSEAAYAKALAISRQKLAEKEKLEQDISHKKEEMHRFQIEKEERDLADQDRNQLISRMEAEWKLEKAEEAKQQEQLTQLTQAGERDGQQLKQAQELRFQLLNQMNRMESALAGIRSKREYLEHADKEYANFSRTTKTIMEHRHLFGDAIHGALGELISVPAKYTEAAEVALGGQISNIVTDTTASAGKIIRWLMENKGGRTTFYPLESMKPRYSNGMEQEAAQEPGICGIASALFGCQPMYRNLLDSLLGKTLIAENLDVARQVAKKYNYRLRIVTLDGQLVNAGGSMTGGSMKKKENTYFGRKQEIAGLLAEEQKGRSEWQAKKAEKEKQEQFCDSLAEKLSEEREAWQSFKVALAERKGHLEGMEKTLADRKKQAEESRISKEKADQQMEVIAKELEEAQKKWDSLGDIPEVGQDTQSQKLKASLEKKNQDILQIHVSLTKSEEALAFGQKMEKEREAALKEQQQDREHLEKAKVENQALRKTLQAALNVLKRDFEAAESAWESIRDKQSALQDASDAFTMQQKEADTNWRKAQEESSRIRQNMAEREGRIENFKAQEADELQWLKSENLTLTEAEALRLPGSMADMKAKEEQLAEKIGALGTVNPNGVEAYEEQLARRKFYEEQIADLTQAREGLETIIRDIDKTMAEQFAEAFQKINVEFGRIMQMMFQGGHAKLELTDEAHPLDGGVEMYLQLPGKRRQPLSLMSGGERALTVIALLISFMAYRPAPFCFVDEIDAALDDANVERYSRMIGDYKKKTQFIVISHRKKTMEFADTLQGVTMAEKGVSSLITVKMADYVE